jgi:hypothetical protein
VGLSTNQAPGAERQETVMKRTWPFRIVLLLLVLAIAATAAWAGTEKAVIEVKNKAKSEGEITFTFTPAEGEGREIKVGVINKMKPDEIARDIMKNFTLALGDGYKVKLSGSQKVVIEGIPESKKEKVLFDVVLSGNSVAGVSVVIK